MRHAVVGLCLGLAMTGCITTSSDRQTISSVVKAIVARPGGIEVVKCALTKVHENKHDLCITPLLTLGQDSWSYSNDYLEETSCWSEFIYTGDAT